MAFAGAARGLGEHEHLDGRERAVGARHRGRADEGARLDRRRVDRHDLGDRHHLGKRERDRLAVALLDDDRCRVDPLDAAAQARRRRGLGEGDGAAEREHREGDEFHEVSSVIEQCKQTFYCGGRRLAWARIRAMNLHRLPSPTGPRRHSSATRQRTTLFVAAYAVAALAWHAGANAQAGAGAASAPRAAATAPAPALVYRSLREGTGASPTAADSVRVHYRGTLLDGTEFDSSYKRNEPATFPLGRVIPCWTEGVQRMKVGGKAELVCPPELAYGARGAGGSIPPNATLRFEIELLAINPR